MKALLIFLVSCISVAAQPIFSRPSFIGSLAPVSSTYQSRVLETAPANLFGYWTMGEPSGTTANDSSPENNDGTFSNVTLAQAGFGDGQTSADFNGTSSYLDVYSAGLNTDFSGAEGTAMVWARFNGSWAEGVQRNIIWFRVNDNNRLWLRKTAANQLYAAIVAGAAAAEATDMAYNSGDTWFHACITWSKANDRLRLYINGSLAANGSGMGTWTGSLSSTSGAMFGCESTTPVNVWLGRLASAAVWNTELTAAQVLALSTP